MSQHAFDGDHAESGVCSDIVAGVAEQLPVDLAGLQRKSALAEGRQTGLDTFG